MKKFLSLILAICMICSFSTMIFADEGGYSSKVQIVSHLQSDYEITVPAVLEACVEGYVEVNGIISPFERVSISAPSKVTVTSTTTGSTMELPVTFENFKVYGVEVGTVKVSKPIYVSVDKNAFGTWEGIINYTVVVETQSDESLTGTYYIVDSNDNATALAAESSDYKKYELKNSALPVDVSIGDVFVSGDYEYKYGYEATEAGGWYRTDEAGWGVKVSDTSKSEYGEILESIGGRPVTNLKLAFNDCTNMVVAPEIPNTATNLIGTFYGCTSLTTAPVIPENVLATNLMFKDCTSLEGDVYINAINLESYSKMFEGVENRITLECLGGENNNNLWGAGLLISQESHNVSVGGYGF